MTEIKCDKCGSTDKVKKYGGALPYDFICADYFTGTEIPQGANYYLEGASMDREHRMDQLVKGVLEVNALDAEWKRLVASGNDTAVSIDAMLSKAKKEAQLALEELRDLARMSLSEKPKAIPTMNDWAIRNRHIETNNCDETDTNQMCKTCLKVWRAKQTSADADA